MMSTVCNVAAALAICCSIQGITLLCWPHSKAIDGHQGKQERQGVLKQWEILRQET